MDDFNQYLEEQRKRLCQKYGCSTIQEVVEHLESKLNAKKMDFKGPKSPLR